MNQVQYKRRNSRNENPMRNIEHVSGIVIDANKRFARIKNTKIQKKQYDNNNNQQKYINTKSNG